MEVCIALGIAVFCLVVLLGIIPVGLASRKEAIQNTVATGIVSEVVSDLRASRGSPSSRRFQLPLPSPGGQTNLVANPYTFYLAGNGSRTGNIGVGPTSSGPNPSLYRVTVGFAPPPSSAPSSSTLVRILVSWPAQASRDPQNWPQNLSDSYEVFTSAGLTDK